MVKPIRTFTVTSSLPPEMERQRALVYNLRWAWNHDAIELFRWGRDLWEQSGLNPALILEPDAQMIVRVGYPTR
jgi:starch phosphorylase